MARSDLNLRSNNQVNSFINEIEYVETTVQ